MSKIDFRITSSDYVYMDFDYDRDLINYIKSNIPNRKYVKRSKEWKFKLTKNTLSDFMTLLSDWDIDKDNVPSTIQHRMKSIIEEAKEHEKRKKKNEKIINADEVDLEVKGLARGMNLYPFQEVAVKYVEKNQNVLIGDEQGLGKTVESIASIHHLDAYPVLVVCPASLKDNWEREWNTWLPRKSTKVQHSSDGLDLRARVVIINYDILWKYRKELKNWGFKGLILDESHYIKNSKAKRSKAARQIAKKIDGPKILLSGTAVVNRPKELINQLKTLDVFKKEFGNFYNFANRFCGAKKTPWGMDYSGASNLEELHERLAATCYIRRNKKDVLPDLPDKQRQYIEMDITNRKEYDLAEEDLVAYYKKAAAEDENFLKSISHLTNIEQEKRIIDYAEEMGRKAEYAEDLMRLSALRKLASKGKMKEVKSWIKDFLETGEQLVVFGHHKEAIEEIVEEFNALKINGDVPIKDRQQIVDDFQNGKNRLIVLNIQSGGTGLTLTSSTNVAFIELPWTPGEVAQCEDRCHRIGTKSAVNIYFLLGRNTIDMHMFELLKKKRVITEAVNRGEDITDESGNIIKGVIQKLEEKHEK